MTMKQQERLAKMGAFIEHTLLTLLGSEGLPASRLVEILRGVGVERCVLSSDLGQPQNPDPVEGWRLGVQRLLEAGLHPDEFELLAKENPGNLIL